MVKRLDNGYIFFARRKIESMKPNQIGEIVRGISTDLAYPESSASVSSGVLCEHRLRWEWNIWQKPRALWVLCNNCVFTEGFAPFVFCSHQTALSGTCVVVQIPPTPA